MEMISVQEDQEIVEKIEEQITDEILTKASTYEIVKPDITKAYNLFDINLFGKELQERSENKNQIYRELAQNINAYDLATNCIGDIVYKLTNTPVESFADKWLPIILRSMLGNAVHSFIQDNTNQFTEREVSIKVPSIRFSGRLDNLIGPEILVEIKSLPYSDYEKIIVTHKPRVADFYQAMTYKYILENHLEETKNSGVKTRTQPPALDKYNIQKVQFIYVAHDVTATDVESFADIIKRIKELKRVLNSKSNTFFFITTLVVDITNNIADPYVNYIKGKLEKINWYLDNNKFPSKSDDYVDTSKCFFCLYKRICSLCK
jgi:hypothetical protein